MNAYDETRMLRRRLQELQDAAPKEDTAKSLPISLLCQTTTMTTYPTTANAYYAVVPVAIGGAMGEGVAPSLSSGTPKFLAANLGGAVPSSGTYVVVSQSGGRYVFTY